MASNPEEADDFYDKCERIISSRTQSIAPSLCYFPCGWKLNAWQEFVDPSICKHLPEIPQYEHLLDPHQGSTKATGAGVNRAIDDTAKSLGISGEPVLVRPQRERKTLWDLLFGDLSEWLPDRARLMETHIGFYYLWK